MIKPIFLALTCLLPLASSAATVYLCKAYSGGMFWSNAHCHQQKSLIERMVTVPDNLPFTQQVQLAEQNRAQAAALSQPPAQVVQSAPTNPQADRQAECKALDAAIANYDAQARQPQTAYLQDWLASQKRKARDRQFQMKC